MNFFSASLRNSNSGINIYSYEKSELQKINENNELNSLGYIIFSKGKKNIYALCEKNNYDGVGIYEIIDNSLSLINFIKTRDKGLCHLTLSPCENYIYIANYHNGSMSVLNQEEEIQYFKYENISRVHMVSFRPSTNELFSVDLGCNLIRIYNMDKNSGSLVLKDIIQTNEGNGPRHLVFLHKNVFYVIFEISNQISVYKNIDNVWKRIQTLSTVPTNFTKQTNAAAIKISGNTLFASNRGHNSIVSYAIQNDFTLVTNNIWHLQYDSPRDFLITADNHLIVAFQKTNNLVLYKISDKLIELSARNNIDSVVGLCSADLSK